MEGKSFSYWECVHHYKQYTLRPWTHVHPATAPSVGQQHGCNIFTVCIYTETQKQSFCICRWCEYDSLSDALFVLAFKDDNSNLGSCLAGNHVTEKDNGGRRIHLTSSVQKSCQLQASFNLRVWTTAWAGSGRIHTSHLLSRPSAQTGFSSWVKLLSTCKATTGEQRGCLSKLATRIHPSDYLLAASSLSEKQEKVDRNTYSNSKCWLQGN